MSGGGIAAAAALGIMGTAGGLGGVDPHSGGVDPHQEAHHLDLEDVQRSKGLHRRQSRRNLHLKETRSMEEYHVCIIGIICII